MLSVLSPAKSLNFDRTMSTPRATQPRLLDEAETLVDVLRDYTPKRLATLMKISPALAELNADRYRAWQRPFNAKNASRAILAFDGDVYSGLELDDYTSDDFAFAQAHVRILSGLYGVLRPLDLMQAYRLEMGTALKVGKVNGLYAYWGDTICALLQKDLKKSGGDQTLINLASDEYFKSVRGNELGAPVIKVNFKEKRDGAWKFISFSAKRARGLMANFIVRHGINTPDGMKDFRVEGYRFEKKLSSDQEWIFGRPDPR